MFPVSLVRMLTVANGRRCACEPNNAHGATNRVGRADVANWNDQLHFQRIDILDIAVKNGNHNLLYWTTEIAARFASFHDVQCLPSGQSGEV